MTFGLNDYERAIARIFNSKGVAIGAGFLVAPGYILTCAHVVLQALGIDRQQFATYTELPTERIELDFPVVAPNRRLAAEIVAWEAYSPESGDVAGLKLLGTVPETIRPLSIQAAQAGAFESDTYFAISFADPGGNRSDNYCYNGRSTGNRLRFRKAQSPDNDETIRAGFSGAPVWNATQGWAIGMLATAQEKQEKAYAIARTSLDTVLQTLSAYSLYDLLQQQLNSRSPMDRRPLEQAIATALRLCDAATVWSEATTLKGRLGELTRLGDRNWGVERLTQFAVFLATIDAVPTELVRQLESWVQARGANFQGLFLRAECEKRDRRVSSAYTLKHLLVEVAAVEQGGAGDAVKVSIWPVGDRDTYDPLNPPTYLVSDAIVPPGNLPVLIDETLADTSLTDCTIHLFVPRAWFDRALDTQALEDEDCTLGSEYKLVLRTNLKTCPPQRRHYEYWQQKWTVLESRMQAQASDTFVAVDCSGQWRPVLKPAAAAILSNRDGQPVGSLFEQIARRTALPLALWSRRDDPLDCLLDLLNCPVSELPEQIRQAREQAVGETEALGQHLCLVWEDPKLVPPSRPLDPEAI